MDRKSAGGTLTVKTLKRIKATGLMTAAEFRKAFDTHCMRFSLWGDEILAKLSGSILAYYEQNLACASVADLGLQRSRRELIYRVAQTVGLYPCLLTDALYLRLQYPEQPRCETLIVATNEFACSEGLYLPTVEHDVFGSLWLGAIREIPSDEFNPAQKFVFRHFA